MTTIPFDSPAPPLSTLLLSARLAEAQDLLDEGRTADRWAQLAAWGREDLALAKVLEPHLDATAILSDLSHPSPVASSIWGVWAAEPPFAVLTADRVDGSWRLTGRKAFCSGARLVTHALATARTEDGSRLFSVDLADPGVRVDGAAPAWMGSGMRRAATETLDFDRVEALAVGEVGDYTARAGFWHGAIGVAACWFGGALGVADTLERSTDRLDAHGAAHLGAVRASVLASRASLHLAAEMVDTGQVDDAEPAEHLAHAVRSVVAGTVEEIISRVGRALGPGPLAFDADHATRVQDLQVFVRQHHGERDLERLGRLARRD